MVDISAPLLDIPCGTDFLRNGDPDPHRLRRREIVKSHPEVRRLRGANPWSGLLALAAGQLGMAWVLAEAPVWLIPLAAFGVGAFFAAALNALIHEASHNLIFRGRRGNHAIALVAN